MQNYGDPSWAFSGIQQIFRVMAWLWEMVWDVEQMTAAAWVVLSSRVPNFETSTFQKDPLSRGKYEKLQLDSLSSHREFEPVRIRIRKIANQIPNWYHMYI